MAAQLPQGTRLVRVMPNTPALVGLAASAYAPGATATKADSDLVKRIFQSIGVGQCSAAALATNTPDEWC